MEHMSWAVCFVFNDVVASANFTSDNEFTQLMKGLQGERLRQAFKYLDKDEDGFIRPDQFKQIILVRLAHL
jgi:Ca2+-binding EF-hand superfamily protein